MRKHKIQKVLEGFGIDELDAAIIYDDIKLLLGANLYRLKDIIEIKKEDNILEIYVQGPWTLDGEFYDVYRLQIEEFYK